MIGWTTMNIKADLNVILEQTEPYLSVRDIYATNSI